MISVPAPNNHPHTADEDPEAQKAGQQAQDHRARKQQSGMSVSESPSHVLRSLCRRDGAILLAGG